MANMRFTVQQVADALRQAHGDVSAVAHALKCDRSTIYNYIRRHATLSELRDDERAAICDEAESLVAENIRLARKEQKDTQKTVDTSDARWWLSKMKKDEFGDEVKVVEEVQVDIGSLADALTTVAAFSRGGESGGVGETGKE